MAGDRYRCGGGSETRTVTDRIVSHQRNREGPVIRISRGSRVAGSDLKCFSAAPRSIGVCNESSVSPSLEYDFANAMRKKYIEKLFCVPFAGIEFRFRLIWREPLQVLQNGRVQCTRRGGVEHQ